MTEQDGRRRGRPANAVKSITVRVAVSPALHANLLALVTDFGWGIDPADVLRTIAIREVARLQDQGRLPDAPLKI